MTDSEKILSTLGLDEVLAQLAEEATELAQAALKYRRALTGKNPTPVPPQEALEHLREEIADVSLALEVSGVCEINADRRYRMNSKRTRWLRRIEDAKGGPA